MKLFLKHLTNSIRKRPLQPIILIITLTLAVFVCFSSIMIKNFIDGESSEIQRLKYGKADVTITLDSSSESRFMFTENVKEVLGNDTIVVGTFELPMLNSSGTIFGVATDFYTVSEVFNFDFSSYGQINENRLNEIALISRQFADSQSLSVGDSFNIRVLGKERNYVVEAISETQFLTSYDVMLDVRGVVEILAEDSPFVSALGSDFKPYSALYIKLSDGISAVESINLLRQNATDFNDKNFLVVSDVSKLSDQFTANIIFGIVVFLICALTITVVYCCFYILSNQRTLENDSFISLGAKPIYLQFLQYFEIFIYTVVGSIFGFLISALSLDFIVDVIGLKVTSAYFSFSTAVLTFFIVLVSSEFTVLLLNLGGKKSYKGNKRLASALVLVAFIISFVCMFLMPKDQRLLISIITSIIFLIILFIFVPQLFKWFFTKIDSHLSRKAFKGKKLPISLLYSVKMVKKVKVLLNISRLLVLLFTITFTVFFAIQSAVNVIEANLSFLNGDFLLNNSTASCEEKIRSLSSVDEVYYVYTIQAKSTRETNKRVTLLSASDRNAFSDIICVEELPSGNNAVLSISVANRLNKKVGDELDITVGDKVINLKVSQISDTCLHIILFDSSYFNIAYNALTVKGIDGISLDLVREDLTKATALEFAGFVSVADFIELRIKEVNLYLNSGYLLMPFALLFSIIGIIDNLIESYRSRREEFSLFSQSGVSDKNIIKIKFNEIVTVILFAIIFSLFTFILFLLILDVGLLSTGYPLIKSVIKL